MPPKRKAKEKKESEESEKQLKNSRNKESDESITKLRKVSLPQTVKQKKQKDETASVGHNGRKRKTESKVEEKNRRSFLTKIKAKEEEEDDDRRGDKVDDSKRKSRSNKKLKLEENRNVETGKKSVGEKAKKLKAVFKEENDSGDGSDYTKHSKRSQSKSKGKNGKKSLKTNKDVLSKRENNGIDSGNSLQESDTSNSNFEDVECACDKKRPDELAAGDKETENLDNEVGVMSDSGNSDFEEISSQTSPSSFQKSTPQSEKRANKTEKGRPGKRKGNDDQGGGDESKVGKRRRSTVKKGKLEQNITERDKKLKYVIKDENGSDDASKHSKRSQSKCKGKVGKKSLKTVKITSLKEESSVDAGNSFQESDTDDSDFEEVENNCDEKRSNELAAVDVQTKDLGKEVGLMSDSDSSDFDEVTSQKSKSSRKSRSTLQSKKQTAQTRKSKTGIKKENDSVAEKTKSVPGKRKRQSKESAKKSVIKKVKTDLIEEVPFTSASVSASALSGVDEDDVTAVLLRMEGASCSQPSTSESQNYRLSEIKGSSLSDADSDDDDDGEDWEEVEDHKGSPLKSRIPTEPVEITLEAPDFMKKKRKKKKFDWLAYIQQTMRRFQKHVQINLHKAHLLCLLSHGLQQNRICNDDLLKAQAMSIIPTKWTGLESSFTKDNIRQLLKWFHDEFQLHAKSEYFSDPDSKHGLVKSGQLENIISTRQIPDGRTLAIIFIVILRTLGIDVRLVMSIHPMGFKILESKKYKVKSKNGESSQVEHDQDKTSQTSQKSRQTKKSPKETKTVKKKKVKSKVMDCSDDDNTEDSGDRKVKPEKVKIDKGKAGKNSKAKNTSSRKSSKGKQLLQKSKPESDSDSEEEVKPKRNLRTKERKNMTEKNEDEVSESGFDEFEPSDSESDFTDEDYKVKKRRGRQKSGEKHRKDNNTKSGEKEKGSKKKKTESKRKSTEEMSEDVIELSSEEFTEEETTFRSPLQEKLKRKNRKVLSSDSDGSESSVKSGGDIWTEVFLPGEKRWVCVDCVQNIVDKPYDVESGITQPVHYVLAYTADGCVSDVTARYASQWMSQTRKLRVDQEWWTETLEPYKSQIPEHGDKDEESIKDQLMKRPLPTSIGEFKNHPLYALPRHLLKFEAIYPNTAIPFGYIRGEAIYARECVHTLHSRENWLKEGRAVRLGEEAYKMVKSRKRWRQPVKPDPNVLDLELFGYWQTEKYIPPPAVDGKITRNEYGNIELFKPWMLPAGTVHLHGFPALNRVAKKLGLDCVPAMIDWETHGGFSHPLIDGWVVCEEHKDILIAAWDEDQEIQRQRDIAKREKRVLGNWKLLTRSLLIRERLKKKFDLKEADPEEMVDVKSGEKATDTQQAWPRNRETEKKKTKLPKHVEEM